MVYPAKLLPGDTVGLVCPCSPITEERLQACVRTVEALGYRVKVAGTPTENHGGYMAGSGKLRANAINALFADREVKAIFCLRGGDGGTRTVPYLNLDLVRRNPKIFVGYSDVTTLHLLFNQNCGLVTFHGPMVSSNMVDAFDADTRRSFFAALNGDGLYTFRNPAEEPIRVLHPGRAEGMVIGGNLSLLSAAMGTPYAPDTRGKILFIEEVEEPVTKIEKWMCQLRNSGALAACSGILLGQFTDISNKELPGFLATECIRELTEDLDLPILYNLQSGHGEKIITLPFGAHCVMDSADRSVTFRIDR